MTAIRIGSPNNGFGGIVPRTSTRLLAQGQAQIASNLKISGGQLAPLKAPKLVNTPGVTGIKTIFRMNDAGVDRWLAWEKDVDVARSPLAGDTSGRIFYTGDGEPKWTDIATAKSSTPYPYAFYCLGLPAPVTAPTISPSGGSGAQETRYYCYTFVDDKGQESAPSPISASVTSYTDATYTVTASDVAPPNSGSITAAVKDTPTAGTVRITFNSVFGLRTGEEISVASVAGMTDLNGHTYPITDIDVANKYVFVAQATTQTYSSGGTWTRRAPHYQGNLKKRLYYTATGDTTASMVLVTNTDGTAYEIAASSTSFTHSAKKIGESLPTIGWVQPYTDLAGLTVLPSGALVGFSKNRLCFSAPYKPYAWPSTYELTTDSNIVAIGVFAGSIAVWTQGAPYQASGFEPESFTMVRIDQVWPCQSKRGVVSMGYGVFAPVPQGLAMIGLSGTDLVTKAHFTIDEWREVFPATLFSAAFDDAYFGAYQLNDGAVYMLVFKPDLGLVSASIAGLTALYADYANGKLYLVCTDSIYEWDADDATRLTMVWLSKEFVLAKPTNMAAAKLDADFSQDSALIEAALAAYNAVVATNVTALSDGEIGGEYGGYYMGEHSWADNELTDPPNLVFDSVTFTLYTDGEPRYSKTLSKIGAFRLPGGYKSDRIAISITANIPVHAVSLAETMAELAQV